MGWTLKSTPRKVRFTQEQKNFLDLKYNLGEQTGKKSSGEDESSSWTGWKKTIRHWWFLNHATNHFLLFAYGCQEERENLIHDVTAEITERIVAEEEEQPVSEVQSRSCCYSYRRVNLCRMSRDELQAKQTLSNLNLKNFSGSWDNCLNCPASARIISSFDFKHCTSYNVSFIRYMKCFIYFRLLYAIA